jgi:CheY-like chemotaxis protein
MTPHILLVEDNPADVFLIREALTACGICCHLHVVRDGEGALAFLRGETTGTSITADFAFLDLNMPGIGGRDLLGIMKADPKLRSLPVAVLSTSILEDDIRAAYELGANCYIVKPVGFEALTEVVLAVSRFWFSAAVLPSRAAKASTD